MTYEERKQTIQNKINNIQDFFEKMEAAQELIDLDIEYGKIKPNSGEYFECVGCGS